MAHPHAAARSRHHERAHHIIKATGYAHGGAVHDDEAEDAAMIKSAVHQHETHDHKGQSLTKLKLASGGHVDGDGAHHHLGRRARGGHTGRKSTHVNVIVAPQGGGGMQHPMMPTAQPAAMPPPRPPAPSAAPAAMGAAPPRPGMGGPPGAMGMMPRQPGMKRGGGVQKVEEVGAGKHDAFLQAKRGGHVKRAHGGHVPHRDFGGPANQPPPGMGAPPPPPQGMGAPPRPNPNGPPGGMLPPGAPPMAGQNMVPPTPAAQAVRMGQPPAPPPGMGAPGAPPMGGPGGAPPPRPMIGPPGAGPMGTPGGPPVQRTMGIPGQKRGGEVKVREHTRRARGGNVPHMDAGAGGGEGRIEKVHEYGEGRGFKPKKVPLHA